jgi:hypothetical protein
MTINQAEITTILYKGEPYQFVEAHKMNSTQLASALGYSYRTVLEMKAAGCPFFGQFSTVQIVRQWEYRNKGWRQAL